MKRVTYFCDNCDRESSRDELYKPPTIWFESLSGNSKTIKASNREDLCNTCLTISLWKDITYQAMNCTTKDLLQEILRKCTDPSQI